MLFQLGWFAGVYSPQYPALLGITALVVAIHLAWLGRGEIGLLVAVTLLGTLIDSALMHGGLFVFPEGQALLGGWVIPAWLVLMWTLLATTLRHCLDWTARPVGLACVLGAVSAPLSYYAGARITGVQLPYGLAASLLTLAMLWAVLFPLLHALARRLQPVE